MKRIILDVVAVIGALVVGSGGALAFALTGVDEVTTPVVNGCPCQSDDRAFQPESHPVAQDVGVFAAKLDPDWAMTPSLRHHRGFGCVFTGPYEVRHVRGVGAVVFRVHPHTPVGFRFLIEVSAQPCGVAIDLDGSRGDLRMRYVCEEELSPGCTNRMPRALTGARAPKVFK